MKPPRDYWASLARILIAAAIVRRALPWVAAAVLLGRRGIGIELKPSYYRQAVKNVQLAAAGRRDVAENHELDLGEVEAA